MALNTTLTSNEVELLTYGGLQQYTAKVRDLITAAISGVSSVPTGSIVMWSGTSTDVPSGWALCDGQNGTPDLRDRFIIGASTAHPQGTSGGSSSISLSVENLPSHSHSVSGVTITDNGQGGSLFTGGEAQISAGTSGNTGPTGSGTPVSNLPPFYALAFIMKT